MKGSHGSRAYPADKMIPVGALRRPERPHTENQRRAIKQSHTRKARAWRKVATDEQWRSVSDGLLDCLQKVSGTSRDTGGRESGRGSWLLPRVGVEVGQEGSDVEMSRLPENRQGRGLMDKSYRVTFEHRTDGTTEALSGGKLIAAYEQHGGAGLWTISYGPFLGRSNVVESEDAARRWIRSNVHRLRAQ